MGTVLRRSPLPLRSVLGGAHRAPGPEPAGETVPPTAAEGVCLEGCVEATKFRRAVAQRNFPVLPGHGPDTGRHMRAKAAARRRALAQMAPAPRHFTPRLPRTAPRRNTAIMP